MGKEKAVRLRARRKGSNMRKDKRFVKILTEGTVNVTEIWVDLETGVNYLWHSSGYSGGLTPLLDREGKPVIDSAARREEYK